MYYSDAVFVFESYSLLLLLQLIPYYRDDFGFRTLFPIAATMFCFRTFLPILIFVP